MPSLIWIRQSRLFSCPNSYFKKARSSAYPREELMEKGDRPFEGVTAMVSQNIEQAAKAMQNYLQFVQEGISSTPWGKTDLSEKIKSNLEKNIATAFEYAQKLISAKDIQDAVRIQTEFMQTQLQTLNEQAQDLSETATKAITDRFKSVSS